MKIALVDDEVFFLDTIETALRSALKQNGISDIQIDRFHSPAEFREHWVAQRYSLIFLDIYMNDQTGIDLARYIRETDQRTILIFCTTSNEFASQSYEVNASYYLRKPVSEEDMLTVLKRIDFSQIRQKQILTLPDQFQCVLYDIEYTVYNNHVVTFYYASSEPHQVYMSQTDLEKLLLSYEDFFSINRGTVVNLRMIDRLESKALYTSDGSYLPISRSKYKSFTQEFADFKLRQLEKKLG